MGYLQSGQVLGPVAMDEKRDKKKDFLPKDTDMTTTVAELRARNRGDFG